jgi:uncharacterized MAPEG superfamily protein
MIPYVTVAYAKSSKGFDNADPRNELPFKGAKLRALNAQLNGYEVFPFFAFAVLFAELKHASLLWIDVLAVLFIVIRLVYTWAYISNKPTIRSLVFTLGFLVTTILFFLPLFA